MLSGVYDHVGNTNFLITKSITLQGEENSIIQCSENGISWISSNISVRISSITFSNCDHIVKSQQRIQNVQLNLENVKSEFCKEVVTLPLAMESEVILDKSSFHKTLNTTITFQDINSQQTNSLIIRNCQFTTYNQEYYSGNTNTFVFID